MINPFRKIFVFAGLCLLIGTTYAGVSKHQADMVTMPAHDPKKKKAGEECKAANECQRHHSCETVGDKSVCVAPEPREIPKT